MEADYVKRALGPALTDALSLLSMYRPDDPVEWLASYLRHEAKRQEVIAIKQKEQDQRDMLLKKAKEEEERLAELKREEERLANLRKPNSYQLDCMAYLQKITELEKKYGDSDAPMEEIGKQVMLETRKSLSDLKLSDEARTLVEEPPQAIQQLVRAGMLISGYPLSKVEHWSDMASNVLNEYALERYEAFDIKSAATKYDIKEAVQAVDGVDFLARPVQKHPLGPLATRFHTFVKAALQSFGFDPSQFLRIEAVEEDRQSFQRTVWCMPEKIDEALHIDSDDEEAAAAAKRHRESLLSTLAGMDRHVLPKEFTSKSLRVEVWWESKAGEETDADASLIMFSEHGQPLDSVYHVVRLSKDGAIKHMGDMGEETEAESFLFSFPDISKDVHVIAVVLNVATDGDSLEMMETCGLRLIPRVLDEETTKEGDNNDEANAESEDKQSSDKGDDTGEAGAEQEGEKQDKEQEDGDDEDSKGDADEKTQAGDGATHEDESKGEEEKEDNGSGEGTDEQAGQDSADTPPAKELDPILSMGLDARLIDKHEVLLALVHRDQEDLDLWHVVGVGEQVKGEWREKEESQNFLNALPLSQRYIELLGIRRVDHTEKKVMHPFKMVPGDCLEVPALAVEHPVVIGMGWDVDPDVAMDLDCGLAVYSRGQRTDYCDFEKLVSNDNAIHHQGDNRDGEGEGDDESIIVEFNKLDPETDTLFLYAAVYEGGALRDVENVHIRMLSKRGGKQKEICRFSLDWLARVEDDTAVILAKISRTPEHTWLFHTIGTTAPGRTIEELESRLTELL